jgi:hypothetical protein
MMPWSPPPQLHPSHHASHIRHLPPAVPSPSTWPLPANPPANGCRPGNSSTFVSFPNENYGWQLYLTGDGFNDHRFKCKANNNYGSGGRMFSPRSLFQQSRIESYFARLNPSMTRYWLGIKQSTIGSRTKYKYTDGISYTVRWVAGVATRGGLGTAGGEVQGSSWWQRRAAVQHPG